MEKKIDLKTTLIAIGVYVIGMSAAENIFTDSDPGLRVIPAALIFVALMLLLKKRGSFAEIGLTSPAGLPFAKLLFCVPMLFLMTVNLWRGAVMRYDIVSTILYALTMLLVGAIEEILFRGLLLRLLMKDSVKTAIIISSVTFGLGHIVNLLNGEDFLSTILQVVYAISIGFMLSVFAVKVGNIVPGIIFHGVFNALSVFANNAGLTDTEEIVTSVIICAVSLGYMFWLLKKVPEKALK